LGADLQSLNEAATFTAGYVRDANKGRATKGAALGYLGKAYLFNKDYTKAAQIFKQIIDSHVYALMPNYEDISRNQGK